MKQILTSKEDNETARTNLLKYGDEAVPYLASILKKMKASKIYQPEREYVIFGNYGVYLWDGSDGLDGDYAGTASIMLAQIGGNAIPILVEIIMDKRFGFQLRWRALVGIRFIKKPASQAVTDALISCLADDSDLRALTITAIGDLEIKSALPELNKLLKDTNPSIQKAAKEAIQKLQGNATE